MYELIQTGNRSFYINCPAKIGVFRIDGSRICLIDSGSDKDAGRKVRQIMDREGIHKPSPTGTRFPVRRLSLQGPAAQIPHGPGKPGM